MSDEGQPQDVPVQDIGPMSAPTGGPDLSSVRRVRWLNMPDEYGRAGFRIRVWTNAPSGLMDDAVMADAPGPVDYSDLERRARALQDREAAGEDVSAEIADIDDETAQRSRDWREQVERAQARRIEALTQIVVEHNGWKNEGKPLPAPTDPEFWHVVPDELQAAIILLVRKEGQRLPSGIARAGGRR